MNATFTRSALLVVLASLGGCATLSESECRYSDWYDIGHRDGRQGLPADRVSKHAEACAEHRVAPDRERYLEGHAHGIESYCTVGNGLSSGESGGSYYGVCGRGEEEADFMRGYSLGQALHRTRSRLGWLDGEIYRVDASIKDGEKDEEKKLSPSEVAAIVYRRLQLESERGELREQLRRLEWEADSLRAAL